MRTKSRRRYTSEIWTKTSVGTVRRVFFLWNSLASFPMNSFFNFVFLFQNECQKLLCPPSLLPPIWHFSVNHSYKSSAHHMDRNPVIVQIEWGVFAHSLCSSFAQKLHALVAVGQSGQKEGRTSLACSLRWCMVGGEDAVLHGNRLIVCMGEVMALAGHQTQPE